jgi:hypothetical protein
MKALIAAAALALAAAIQPAAATEVQSGYWKVFDTPGDADNKPLCGMSTSYADVNASIMIKYVLGTDKLMLHVFKQGWRFPAQPVTFQITLGFDQTAFGSTTAIGENRAGVGPLVEFYVANKAIDNFLKAFSNADWLWINFDEGSEKLWTARMVGSRRAADLFAGCIRNLIGANSTQPYGESSTQPYGNGTQPYGNGSQPYRSTQPAPVPSNPAPVVKKDNGAI